MIFDQILAAFTEKEYKEFLAITRPRSRSRKLAQLLRKGEEETDRDILFYRLFRQKRVAENDYLLRNELSILKKRVENHLVSPEETAFNRYYTMARWCLERRLVAEAEKYALDAKETALSSGGWEQLLKVHKILLQTLQYGKSNYVQKLEQMKLLENQHREYLQNLVAEETRYADFIRAGAHKLASNLRTIDIPFSLTEQITVTLEKQSTPVADYYCYKAMAYASSGKRAIRHLQKALECLRTEDTGHISVWNEILTCQSAMAMEYSLSGEFAAAENLFREIIIHKNYPRFTGKNAVLLNFGTTLLKLKNYREALKYLNLIDSKEPIIRERIFSMKCNCYIFLEDLKGIRSILPKDLNQYDLSVKTYYRLLYMIYYTIRNEYELARREILNLTHTRQLETMPYGPLLRLAEKYILAVESIFYREKSKAKKIKSLQQEIRKFASAAAEVQQMLPAMWILEKSAELMKN